MYSIVTLSALEESLSESIDQQPITITDDPSPTVGNNFEESLSETSKTLFHFEDS